MKVGGKRKLHIPAKLAYGELGASSFHTFHGYRTPPNRSMDIIVELIEIKEAKESSEQKKERRPLGTYP